MPFIGDRDVVNRKTLTRIQTEECNRSIFIFLLSTYIFLSIYSTTLTILTHCKQRMLLLLLLLCIAVDISKVDCFARTLQGDGRRGSTCDGPHSRAQQCFQ